MPPPPPAPLFACRYIFTGSAVRNGRRRCRPCFRRRASATVCLPEWLPSPRPALAAPPLTGVIYSSIFVVLIKGPGDIKYSGGRWSVPAVGGRAAVRPAKLAAAGRAGAICRSAAPPPPPPPGENTCYRRRGCRSTASDIDDELNRSLLRAIADTASILAVNSYPDNILLARSLQLLGK